MRAHQHPDYQEENQELGKVNGVIERRLRRQYDGGAADRVINKNLWQEDQDEKQRLSQVKSKPYFIRIDAHLDDMAHLKDAIERYCQVVEAFEGKM